MSRLAEALTRAEPTIAVPFTDVLSTGDIDAISTLADIAEFRADCFPSTDLMYLSRQMQRLATMPILLTIRHLEEGGQWADTDAQRLQLFQILAAQAEGIDVELEAAIMPEVIELGKMTDKIVIASSHDFDTTPSADELDDRLGRALLLGAEYFKIAARADTPEQFRTPADFTIRNCGRGIIVVAMGDYGPISRVTLPALGSALTYASPGTIGNAPGQMSYTRTHELLKTLNPGYAELFS